MAQALAGWKDFYVIVGSAAGALIGLEFVVIALVTSVAQHLIDRRTLRAFATPAVVYITSVLVVAALLNVPHLSVGGLRVIFVVFGLIGAGYLVWVTLHLHREEYSLDWEDRLFYTVTPAASYGAFVVAGLLLRSHATGALDLIAAAAMLLLITGIHNTWDAAVWTIATAAHQETP